MALFETDWRNGYAGFDNGTFGCATTPVPIRPWGCRAGYTIGPCMTYEPVKNISAESTPIQQVTFRTRMSFDRILESTSFQRQIFWASNGVIKGPPCVHCSSGGGAFLGGHLDLTCAPGAGSPVNIDHLILNSNGTTSLHGVIPVPAVKLNGIPHGFQYSLNFTSTTTVDFQIAVDGVVVSSGTATSSTGPWLPPGVPPYCQGIGPWGFPGISCIHVFGTDASGSMGTNYHFEYDTSVSIKSDYAGCLVLEPAIYEKCSVPALTCPWNVVYGPQFGGGWTRGVPLDNNDFGNYMAVFPYGTNGVGSRPPYVFSLIYGALPPGLTLNTSTGQITGTPVGAGNFAFRGSVYDAFGVVSNSDICIGTVSEKETSDGCPS